MGGDRASAMQRPESHVRVSFGGRWSDVGRVCVRVLPAARQGSGRQPHGGVSARLAKRCRIPRTAKYS
eukprot:4685630-Prymnesium_polylepis.1